MKVHFNAFWDGFLEKTNQNHCDFFLELLKRVFKEECTVGTFEDSDILVESLFGKSIAKQRDWRYKIQFSGETVKVDNSDDQDALLGTADYPKSVNCPLFVSQTWCTCPSVHYAFPPKTEAIIPPIQAVLVLITNPTSEKRTRVLDRLHAANIPVAYAGGFRQNVPRLLCQQGTPEFHDQVKECRFIASFENETMDHQITEKMLHGLNAGIMPIYWGCKKITEYFNEKRFINVKDHESDDWIKELIHLFTDNDAYRKKLKETVYENGTCKVTIDTVAEDLRKMLSVT